MVDKRVDPVTAIIINILLTIGFGRNIELGSVSRKTRAEMGHLLSGLRLGRQHLPTVIIKNAHAMNALEPPE